MPKENSRNLIFEGEIFTLEQGTECPIPGYLVLRVKGEATSLAQLPAETTRALGEMLARAARAIEETVGAERVYILSFCEVERRLHFHLFPRTAWLLKEYFQSNSGETEPVNGPALFEWARKTIVLSRQLPVGMAGGAAVAGAIGAALEREA